MDTKLEIMVITAPGGTAIGEYSFVVLPRTGDWIELPDGPDAATMFEVVKVVHPVTGDSPDIYVQRLGDNHEALDRLCSERSGTE